jgi:hypothetical protein
VFTAVPRALGLHPGDLTDNMIAAAVRAHIEETDDLDFKAELPPTSNPNSNDLPERRCCHGQ